jgi:hypothetical protein
VLCFACPSSCSSGYSYSSSEVLLGAALSAFYLQPERSPYLRLPLRDTNPAVQHSFRSNLALYRTRILPPRSRFVTWKKCFSEMHQQSPIVTVLELRYNGSRGWISPWLESRSPSRVRSAGGRWAVSTPLDWLFAESLFQFGSLVSVNQAARLRGIVGLLRLVRLRAHLERGQHLSSLRDRSTAHPRANCH